MFSFVNKYMFTIVSFLFAFMFTNLSILITIGNIIVYKNNNQYFIFFLIEFSLSLLSLF